MKGSLNGMRIYQRNKIVLELLTIIRGDELFKEKRHFSFHDISLIILSSIIYNKYYKIQNKRDYTYSHINNDIFRTNFNSLDFMMTSNINSNNDRYRNRNYDEDENEIEEFCQEKIKLITIETRNKIEDSLNQYNIDTIKYELKNYLFNYSDESVSQVIYDILDVKPNESFIKIGGSISDFGLLNIDYNNINNNLTFVENDEDYISFMKLLCIIFNYKINFMPKERLLYEKTSIDKGLFIYNLRNNFIRYEELRRLEYYSKFEQMIENSDRYSSSNLRSTSNFQRVWATIDILLSKLNSNGKVIIFIPKNILTSQSVLDIEYRKYLLKNNFIESIIQLPDEIEIYGHSTIMLVLSHKNEKVRIVDAEDAINIEYDYKTLDLVRFYGAYENASYFSKSELLNQKYLTPKTLLMKNTYKDVENTIKLGECANVFFGCQYTLGKFIEKNKIATQKTNTKILTAGDIDDVGVILWDEVKNYINDDDRLAQKDFKLQRGDIIISTKSSKIKIAVVDRMPEENVILTGGMICIRLKETEEYLVGKFNLDKDYIPYYLKMFLESTDQNGNTKISSLSLGNSVKSIRCDDLSDLIVFAPNVEKDVLKMQVREYEAKIRNYERWLNNSIIEAKEIENFYNTAFKSDKINE